MKQLLLILTFFFALSLLNAQTIIIPQIADGGGWQTTLVLANRTAITTSASLSFFQEVGGGVTQSWNLPLLESISAQNVTLPGGATLFLHTPGTAGTTTAGWAQIQANTAVVAYAIFTLRVPGRQDQDGTAQAAAGTARVLVPFDNTNGFVTTLAIADNIPQSETIAVGIRLTSGVISHPDSITLPALGHTAFSVPKQFPSTIGQSGLLELYSPSGNISVLALRFNTTGAFTTAPAYAEGGPPIIASSGSTGGGTSGGGTLPQFSVINITPSTLPIAGSPPQLGILSIQIALPTSATGITYGAILGGPYPPGTPSQSATILAYSALWNQVAVSGQTLTLSDPQLNVSTMATPAADIAFLTSASMTITLSPTNGTNGTVTGSMTLVSRLATISGTFTGTYTAQ